MFNNLTPPVVSLLSGTPQLPAGAVRLSAVVGTGGAHSEGSGCAGSLALQRIDSSFPAPLLSLVSPAGQEHSQPAGRGAGQGRRNLYTAELGFWHSYFLQHRATVALGFICARS